MAGSAALAIDIAQTPTDPAKQANVTTSCTDCIRAGWVWCSNKWNYEAPISKTWSTDFTATYLSQDEVGQCCYTGDQSVTGPVTNTSGTPYADLNAFLANTATGYTIGASANNANPALVTNKSCAVLKGCSGGCNASVTAAYASWWCSD